MSDRNKIVSALRAAYNSEIITRTQLNEFVRDNPQFAFPHWLCNDRQYRVGRGEYRLPTEAVADARKTARAVSVDDDTTYVPDLMEGYVKFGNHADLDKIVKSRRFVPTFLSGLSGCGKTTSAIQVCAEQGRECIRVNITIETDEDDLIGGFRLIDGETVFSYGPVIEAMRRGAVLVLDEIDLGSNKIMCLQPVLEGKSFFIKKIGEWVHPAPGFTVIATANTKGQGDGNGKFVGTNVLNEAFLDRFAVTMDQDYPTEAIETRILNGVLERQGAADERFVTNLVTWANAIRKTFDEGAIDEVISTRRLVYIAETFAIFGDRQKAIEMVVRRFNPETRLSMLSLYAKVDETISGGGKVDAPVVDTVEVPDGTSPFPY
jgi:MoxR-like ATPase